MAFPLDFRYWSESQFFNENEHIPKEKNGLIYAHPVTQKYF
jgi:hypothetical protein